MGLGMIPWVPQKHSQKDTWFSPKSRFGASFMGSVDTRRLGSRTWYYTLGTTDTFSERYLVQPKDSFRGFFHGLGRHKEVGEWDLDSTLNTIRKKDNFYETYS